MAIHRYNWHISSFLSFLPERDYVTFGSLLSQIHLSLTFVRRTQGVETSGNISLLLCTLAIVWPTCKILRRSSQGNPSVGCVSLRRSPLNARRVSQIRLSPALSRSIISSPDEFLIYFYQCAATSEEDFSTLKVTTLADLFRLVKIWWNYFQQQMFKSLWVTAYNANMIHFAIQFDTLYWGRMSGGK